MIAHFQPFDFSRNVIDVTIEPVAAEPDLGKPKMLDDVALAKGFLYFKIGLSGSGTVQRLDEDAHCAARLHHSPFHPQIMQIYVKYLWLKPGLKVFPGQSVIRPRAADGPAEKRAGEDGW